MKYIILFNLTIKMSFKNLIIMIDSKLRDSFNGTLINTLQFYSDKGYFEFKPFEQLKDGFDEMSKNAFRVIYVIVQGFLYQDYFKELKKLRINNDLTFIPKTFIFTSLNYKRKLEGEMEDENLESETLESIGDKFYNPGGIGTQDQEIYLFIKRFLNINIISLKETNEISSFYFDTFDDDKILALLALDNLNNKNNFLVKENEINDLHYLLRSQHSFEKFINFLDSRNNDIDIETKFLINYYTSNSTFYQAMNNDFNYNYFSTFKTFIKLLYRGLHKKILQSKFDVCLYSCSPLKKEKFEDLQKNLNAKKKTLVYSKQFQSFTQSEEIAKNYLANFKDKNYIPILYELPKLEVPETYTSNVDIGDLSQDPNNKEVLFFPYACFIVEKIEEKQIEINSKKIKVKFIKLNYLDNYLKKINENKLIEDLNVDDIKNLLSIRTNFIKDINERNKNEFPIIEQNEYTKSLLLQAKIIKEKNKVKNIIKIEMEKEGKFISDSFFNKYNWMLDIYFDDELQDITTNEINQIMLGKIIIEINYPLFDIEKMFYDCNNIKEINFIEFDTSHIKSLESMFSECNSLVKVNFKTFDTKKVTNMSCLFYNCYSLEELDLSEFKLDNVINMSAMFFMCKNLKDLNFNLAAKKTNKLEDITCLFKGCYSLKNYDLSNFDLSKIKYKNAIN